MEAIVKFQQTLKAPRGQYNSFGKYHYRSCEDIIEALKPIIHAKGFWLNITDEPVSIGNRVYIKATVTITNGEKSWTTTGYAREEETVKGMSSSQITGAASSYARKYALNGLLAIDDNKDSDTSSKEKAQQKPVLDQMMSDWDRAVEFMKKGGKIDAIKEKYELNESDENELRGYSKK